MLQVFANGLIILYAVRDVHFVSDTINNMCGNGNTDLETKKKFVFLGYLWCLLKISDFIDTLFFILLKKQTHVSFLHVYHHSTTMMISFVVFKYVRTEQCIVYAAINSTVHVIMYFYYFLTSVGLKPKWKKMVTIMQIAQFVFLMFMSLALIGCQYDLTYKLFSIYSCCQCVMYIYLFNNFFAASYKKNKVERNLKNTAD